MREERHVRASTRRECARGTRRPDVVSVAREGRLRLSEPRRNVGGMRAEQPAALHSHARIEQVYVIVQGRGEMIVGDERDMVGPGAMILVPPGTDHAIRNPNDETLVYVWASSPAFDPVGAGNWRIPPAE